jgi:hypothetical protein
LGINENDIHNEIDSILNSGNHIRKREIDGTYRRHGLGERRI